MTNGRCLIQYFSVVRDMEQGTVKLLLIDYAAALEGLLIRRFDHALSAGDKPRNVVYIAGHETYGRPRAEEQREKAEYPLFKARCWVVKNCLNQTP